MDCADLCLRSGILADAWAITAISCSSCACPSFSSLRSVPLTTHGYHSRRARCPLLDSSFLTIKSVLARAISRFLRLICIVCMECVEHVSLSIDFHHCHVIPLNRKYAPLIRDWTCSLRQDSLLGSHLVLTFYCSIQTIRTLPSIYLPHVIRSDAIHYP